MASTRALAYRGPGTGVPAQRCTAARFALALRRIRDASRQLTGLVSCAALVLVTALSAAFAQTDYPTRPVRIIVGFGAGAVADTPARLLAQKFSQSLGQQVVVEHPQGA